MTDANQLQIILGNVIVGALDLDPQTFARLEQDAVRPDLNIKFVDFTRLERLPLGVQVDRLPGL